MQKVTVEVRETLKYTRNLEIEIPDDMTEAQLERLFVQMERDDFLGDAIYVLKHAGVSVGKYDEDTDSPDDGEVEITDFNILD